MIGDIDREDFFPAIIGIAKDRSCVAYSFDKLVECFMKANDLTIDEAIEWIDYNVIRALSYYGSRAPTILDQYFITKCNKKYESVKIIITK